MCKRLRPCCVPGCNNKSAPRFFIPTDKRVREIWIERIGNEKLVGSDDLKFLRNHPVCKTHFADICIEDSGRLRKYSLPTLHLPDYNEPSTEENCFRRPETEYRYTTPEKVKELFKNLPTVDPTAVPSTSKQLDVSPLLQVQIPKKVYRQSFKKQIFTPLLHLDDPPVPSSTTVVHQNVAEIEKTYNVCLGTSSPLGVSVLPKSYPPSELVLPVGVTVLPRTPSPPRLVARSGKKRAHSPGGPSTPMEIDMHQCSQCSYTSEWKFQLDHHVQREHTNVYAAQLFHAIVAPEQFSCVSCNFKRYYRWDLYEHYKHNIHHCGNIDDETMKQHYASSFRDKKADNFPCDHCAYKSDSCLFLMKHAVSCGTKTGPSEPVASEHHRNWLQCAKCSYKTTHWGNLKRHWVNHASADEIDWFECTKCSYKAKQRVQLKRHMLDHDSGEDNSGWFKCSECSHKAKSNGYLRRHMLTHASSEEIDWFACAKCSYKTNRKDNLRSHVSIRHASGEEIDWFECAKCSYRSRSKRNLTRHMLRHVSRDEADWFACSKCSYKGKFRNYVTKHMLTHAPVGDVVWFECAKCPCKYRYKSGLKRHMLQHAFD